MVKFVISLTNEHTYVNYCRNHVGVRYRDILPSFCQISHTFEERFLSHKSLKYLPQKIH